MGDIFTHIAAMYMLAGLLLAFGAIVRDTSPAVLHIRKLRDGLILDHRYSRAGANAFTVIAVALAFLLWAIMWPYCLTRVRMK